jgi:hypothetical protein
MAGVQGADELSLEAVEGEVWGDPPPDATRLMSTVYALRHKPLGALSAEDLRVMIAQRVGLDVLVPRALALLERDPMIEGDLYPGDLLEALLRRVPSEYWARHPDERSRLVRLIGSVDPVDIDDELRALVDAFLRAG